MADCHHLDDVIAYAFHQLAPARESTLKAHLAICSACRLKLSEIMDTVDQLGLTAPAVTPPAGLREQVIQRVVAEAAQSRRRRLRIAPSWAAAAAAVAIALGSYSVLQVEGLRERIAGFVQTARPEQTVALQGVASPASARVVFAQEGGGMRITLEGQGLAPLAPGEVYQLWLIKNGQRTSGGVFVVDAVGKGGMSTWLPGEAPFDALGVTHEPDAFGVQPRGPKVMG